MPHYISDQIQREIPNYKDLEPFEQHKIQQHYRREAATFGYRQIKRVEPQNADDSQQGLLGMARQNRENPAELNFEVVRSDDTKILRRGLLPHAHLPASRQTGGQSHFNIRYVGRLFHRGLAWLANMFRGVRSQTFDDPGLRALVEQRNPPQTHFGPFGNTNLADRPSNGVVQASDHDLARMLGYGAGGPGHTKGLNNDYAGAWAISSDLPASDNPVGVGDGKQRRVQSPGLFASGPPRLSDIHQSHNRANCPFMSTLASIMAKPDGAERIQSMMKDNGDGTVTVRFDDRDVRVTKDRLVDRSGKDLFSVGDAPWVRVMEKAYLGYLASKYGDSQKSKAENRAHQAAVRDEERLAKKEKRSPDTIERNKLDPDAPVTNPKDVDHHDFRRTSAGLLASAEKKDSVNQEYRYDWGDTGTVHTAMKHVLASGKEDWANESHDWAVNGQKTPPIAPDSDMSRTLSTTNKWYKLGPEEIKSQIDDALDNGGTVNATANISAMNLAKTMGQRVPPQHFVAIIGKGTQTEVKNGQASQKNGYWVKETFQFGNETEASGGGNDSRADGKRQITSAVCGQDSLFFVTEDDLTKKFTDFQVYAPKWKDPETSPEPQDVEVHGGDGKEEELAIEDNDRISGGLGSVKHQSRRPEVTGQSAQSDDDIVDDEIPPDDDTHLVDGN